MATLSESDRRERRVAALREIYVDEHAVGVRADPDLVPRILVPRSLESDLFLVGQALAKDTQRLSGHPYTFPSGRLSKGGSVLDGWLADLGCTISPEDPDRAYAYHADLHPEYPGRRENGGDVVPDASLVEAAASWLTREIEIIEPKAIICLGREAVVAILARYAGRTVESLADATGRGWEGKVRGRRLAIIAIYHPSAAWRFQSKADNAWRFAAKRLRALPNRSS